MRELRELVRHRAKLVALRSGFKAQVHAVLAKQGLTVPVTDLFGVARPRRARSTAAAGLRLPGSGSIAYCGSSTPSTARSSLADRLHRCPAGHAIAGYRAIQQIPGVGPILRGDLRRRDRRRAPGSPRPRHLCSWAGLTPRHRESDTTVHRGPITKQGSTLVRWAAVEAVATHSARRGWLVADPRPRSPTAAGRNIATVAVARKLFTLVYYGLRDGHIRALQPRPQAGSGCGVSFGPIGRVVVAGLAPDSWRRAERLIDPARSWSHLHHAPSHNRSLLAGRMDDRQPNPGLPPLRAQPW